MTILFYDSLTGPASGVISGRVPATGFNGSAAWSSAQLYFSGTNGRGLTNLTTSSTASAYSNCNGTGALGLSRDVTATFQVAIDASTTTAGVRVGLFVDGRQLRAIVRYNGTVWQMQVTDGSGSEVSTLVTIADPPTWSASGAWADFSFQVTPTGGTLTFGGQSTTLALAPADTSGLDQVQVALGKAVYIAELSVSDPNVPIIVGTSTITLPRPTLSAGNSPAAATASAAITLPRLTILPPSTAVLTLPSLTVSATAHDATGERAFNGTLPSLGLAAFGGANARLTAPSLALSITGRATITGAAPLVLPALDLSATGRTAGQAVAALQLPAIRAGGFSGAVASVTIGGVTLTSSATAGGVGRTTVTLPLFELTAGATRQRSGAVDVSLPALRMATTGAAQIVIPGPLLTAIGTATVAVTYEAYALNLKHQDAESPDELTHYTNYPFDRIVRYQNSYFGMNSTGLYLLEGTTDNGAPIPWSYRTHLTDFKSAQLKNIDTIYFGGRMGPASSVSVHVGEAGVQSYAYTTPRGIVAQNHRQTTGKGMRSRYYAVGASGEGEMTLDTLTINVANLARKV